MLEAFKVKGKNKIAKAVGKINTLVTDLEEGIAEVQEEYESKRHQLIEEERKFNETKNRLQVEMTDLDSAASAGENLKKNIANLLK